METLLEKTIGLMEKNTLPIAQIERDTGISKRWWYKMRNGEIPNPGIVTCQTLADYLESRL